METYRRQIKFCYYKVAEVEFDEDGNSHVTGKFNLVVWLMNMEEEAKVKHNTELSDCIVNLEQYVRFPNENIYAIRAYKLRDANVPSKLKEGEAAIPIPLDPDEYIGEDINFLYDRDRSVCMLQQNRMSIGVSRLVEWINELCPMENKKVVFVPISNHFDANRLGNKSVRSIEFSFANLEPDNKDGSLGQIIGGLNKYNGTIAKITLTVGRDRNAELDKPCIVDLIQDIQTNPGIVNGAKIKLKSENMLDDDKARIEIVDLFENAIHDYIQFDIEKRKPLDFSRARIKMYEKYVEKIAMIEKLCQW